MIGCRKKKWPCGCCYPPRNLAHREKGTSTVDTTSVALTTTPNLSRRAVLTCIDGFVYVEDIVIQGDGENVEVIEALRCRKCVALRGEGRASY
jgi:hypothetical protein